MYGNTECNFLVRNYLQKRKTKLKKLSVHLTLFSVVGATSSVHCKQVHQHHSLHRNVPILCLICWSLILASLALWWPSMVSSTKRLTRQYENHQHPTAQWHLDNHHIDETLIHRSVNFYVQRRWLILTSWQSSWLVWQLHQENVWRTHQHFSTPSPPPPPENFSRHFVKWSVYILYYIFYKRRLQVFLHLLTYL